MLIVHSLNLFENMLFVRLFSICLFWCQSRDRVGTKNSVACLGIRNGGGGAKSESYFFLLFNFSRGPSSEISRENNISD